MPLRDYRGSIDPALKDAGKVVFWQDITDIQKLEGQKRLLDWD